MIGEILPPAVVSVEAFTDLAGERPFPGEEAFIAGAVEKRRREFVTARRCAREALARLSHPPAPIAVGPRREPLWPAGVVGSITHCTGYRAAAVAAGADIAGVGIDAEPNEPVPAGVLASLTVPGADELPRDLAGHDPTICWDRLLFSAKESVYKAWFPLTRRWLGFEQARLSIDPAQRTFGARVLTRAAPHLAEFHGRYVVRDGLIVTAVTVPV